ncbi:hypothetical protein CASFOL_034910 [Castilleja foliolosa]|uniref:Uncharacterized protein n=1 Tax=Castilleja foliolosa TaxID=1961234 RepID=A0ABD3BS02_9LAMI
MVMPIGRGENDTMFPASPFNLTQYSEYCKSVYGVPPRPHWVTTNYGGKDIKLVLKRFGSNIIFSNGLRDPYSSGGVLHNISKNIVAVTTLNGMLTNYPTQIIIVRAGLDIYEVRSKVMQKMVFYNLILHFLSY